MIMAVNDEEITMVNNEHSVSYPDISTDEQLFKMYAKEKEEVFSLREYVSKTVKHSCTCSGGKIKDITHSVLPITKWLPEYKVKESFLRDIASGITVGIVHLPQGMAYSLLASLPPANGLYVSFFPVLIYVLMGTTPHLSIGTFAVVTLMIGAVIDKHVSSSICLEGNNSSVTLPPLSNNTTLLYEQTTQSSSENLEALSCDELNQRKIEIAIALSVAVALIHFGMYVLRLGIIHVFLSSHMVSGFTCGAAFHVLTSQVPKLFGIEVARKSGILSIIDTYIDFFKMITTINWATVIISICCILTLVCGKEINRRYSKKLPFPLPWELAIVIFSTLASNFGYFNLNYAVSDVGDIPQGIKTSIPIASDIGSVIVDAIPIAIVIFSISISLSTLFSEKHGYDVDLNQELLAYAVGNAFGSFFQCFPSSASLSRSLVWEQSGGSTQVTGLVSSLLILVALLWIGPLFESLPQAALASIIVVNLKNMLLQFNQLKPLWKVSKLDAITWIVSWLSVVLCGVDLGLYIGVGFSLFTVVLRTQITFGNTMVEIPDGQFGIYRSSKRFDGTRDNDILVFKFPSPLIYANQQRFKNQLAVALGFNPAFEISRREKSMKHQTNIEGQREVQGNELHTLNEVTNDAVTSFARSNNEQCCSNDSTLDALGTTVEIELDRQLANSTCSQRIAATGATIPTYVILDMSVCSFIDNDGVHAIKSLHLCLSKLDIHLLLARCTADVRRCLILGGFPKHAEDSENDKPIFFIRLRKAVNYARSNSKMSFHSEETL